MDDYNVNVLSEAKNEYSSRLVTILTPLMLEGVKSIFDEAAKLCLDNDEEEKYLIRISDKDAYDNEHFINYTKQPLLKVYSWRHLINWKIFREHAKINLKLNIPKHKIIIGLITMLFNKIFKTKFNSTLEQEMGKFTEDKVFH